jgi:hypothetical protein
MSISYRYPYRYIASKPVKFEQLGDARWMYVEAPPHLANNMAGCPVSKHEYGVIATDRFLLESVQNAAGLTPIKAMADHQFDGA